MFGCYVGDIQSIYNNVHISPDFSDSSYTLRMYLLIALREIFQSGIRDANVILRYTEGDILAFQVLEDSRIFALYITVI
jgi:hypothetical protein